ncbi:uncharacterized protein EI90DRAFT_3082535 [Cantharellus anzutake]|uniref:uncharacterized protein n=1 Tax=Cantharellus anzutake TaxID=1750568 RepID=UPI001904A3DC|nr:uncharacterized protein EI90DRAFT_3082535 [Cantharellus anzutake]KAF8319195.1 hypothetical protein EI90DRAFT_3082535 [Cantharellus anzutake]
MNMVYSIYFGRAEEGHFGGTPCGVGMDMFSQPPPVRVGPCEPVGSHDVHPTVSIILLTRADILACPGISYVPSLLGKKKFFNGKPIRSTFVFFSPWHWVTPPALVDFMARPPHMVRYYPGSCVQYYYYFLLHCLRETETCAY